MLTMYIHTTGPRSLCWSKSSWWSSTSWQSSMPTGTRTCSTGSDQRSGKSCKYFHVLCRVMTKDNIALAALLQTKEACWEGGVPPDHKVFGFLYLREKIIIFRDNVKRPLVVHVLCMRKAVPNLSCSGCGSANLGVLCPHPLGP